MARRGRNRPGPPTAAQIAAANRPRPQDSTDWSAVGQGLDQDPYAGLGNRQRIIASLMQRGGTIEEARQFAKQWRRADGTYDLRAYDEWVTTWGQIDWTQNLGPNGQPAAGGAAAPDGGDGAGGDQGLPPAAPVDDVPTPQEIQNLRDQLQSLGMLEFADAYLDYLTRGYDNFESITNMVQADPKYKAAWDARFAGNVGRNPADQLNPANYIKTERAYAQMLRDSGLPAGFYDNQDAWAQWIKNDVSPLEVQRRIGWAQQALDDTSNEPLLAALNEYYGVNRSDAMAWLLDPQKAEENVLTRKWANAQAGAAARRAGLSGLSLDTASELVDRYGQQDGEGDWSFYEQSVGASLRKVAEEGAGWRGLDSIWGDSSLTEDSLVRDEMGLQGGAQVAEKKKGLASQERAAFSGGSGLGRGSLARRRGD